MNKMQCRQGRREAFPSSLILHPSSFARGFTLLEVLVALVILALALGAAIRAAHIATDSTLAMKQRLIGGWIAENRMAELRTAPNWPELGEKTGEATQAGLQFTWRQSVSASPNPAFRRVEVKVFAGKDTSYASAVLVGYLPETK